jgi:hypothetical protein
VLFSLLRIDADNTERRDIGKEEMDQCLRAPTTNNADRVLDAENLEPLEKLKAVKVIRLFLSAAAAC